MMKVALYPRVSSKRQAEEGDSIDSQIVRLKNYCNEREYEIVGIYTDAGKSASIDEESLKQKISNEVFVNEFKLNQRPAFKKLMQESSQKKFDAIIFYKWDRFSRDISFAELSLKYFNSFGVKLIPTDDTEDLLASSIIRAVGKFEIDKMKDRVRLVRLKRFEDGLFVSKSPLGYKWSKTEKVFLIDKKNAEMIKDIFQMSSEGKSYLEICKKYKLNPQSYYNIIKNQAYIGMIEFEGKIKKGLHPIIINEELFNKCQKKS